MLFVPVKLSSSATVAKRGRDQELICAFAASQDIGQKPAECRNDWFDVSTLKTLCARRMFLYPDVAVVNPRVRFSSSSYACAAEI